MLLWLLVAVWSLTGSARANCDACVDGWCHSQKTLIEGFHVTDQLAIDQTHNVLYVQLNSLNSTIFLDYLKIKMVKLLDTSGMTVDQVTQDLYIAADTNIHIFKYDNNTSEVYAGNETSSVAVYYPEQLFFKGDLYYTSKHIAGLNVMRNDGTFGFYKSLQESNRTITDFVVNKDRKVYFIANGVVEVLMDSKFVKPELDVNMKLTDKGYVLSTDKNGNVYLGDNKVRAIYKLNESNDLIEYAAYKIGSVDRFVFDKENNIVFHDAENGNVLTWKKGPTKCKIHAPQYFSIEELSSEIEINQENH